MPLPPHPGLFTAVERQCAGRNPTPELRLVDGSAGSAGSAGSDDVPITLEQARQMLYDRSAAPAARTALWHQIAERGRLGADGSDWPSAVVWLGLPGLRRTAFRITNYCRAERVDVEAELVTCYLEALAEVEADTADPGGQVLRTACSRAWTVWRKTRPEHAVEDVEGVGGVAAPVPGPSAGLSAGLRITVPAHRVEGVRIGALAQAWGLADTATDGRHQRRGRQVGAISLRRTGRNG